MRDNGGDRVVWRPGGREQGAVSGEVVMSVEVRDEVSGGRTAGTRRPTPRRGLATRVLLPVAVVSVAALTLSACTSPSTDGQGGQSPVSQTSAGGSQTGSVAPSTSAPVPSAVITTVPTATGAINPVTPVTVNVADGRLTSVKMVNPEGKQVAGQLTADGRSWRTTEVLGYSKTYSLSAVAVDGAGRPVQKTAKITTLTPSNMTMPYLNTTAGQSLRQGATYGVGIVPVVHFDEPITDKAAAEKALIVTTVPATKGVWNWVDDQNVHWRAQYYLKPGTKVTVTAKVYGVEVGPGLFGQADQSVSFKIGAKHVSIADDRTHQVKVYFNDKLVRTMPTSMGQGGYVTGKYGQISLWTMPGTYTVIGHGDPVLMDSSTYGLPVNSPKGYKEYIYKATQISTDGIYLHQLETTVWAQGNTDVSHGCLNLNTENATFFYNTSQIGDVVQVLNTGGPKLQIWQNGDWSVPWAQWVKGSALH